MTSSSVVHCPTCHQSVVWDPQNPYRPFCCQRCQLIDLGDWLTEKKVIAEQATPNAPEILTDSD